MSADHLRMYERMTSSSPNISRVPTWYRDEGLKFPSHPRERELIVDYEKAYIAHLQAINVLQGVVHKKSHEPGDQQNLVQLSRCKELVDRASETLKQAEAELRDFIHHSPTERSELLQSEINEWQKELAEAQQAEVCYTEQLLHDPDSLKRRLERLAQGYSDAAEFNQEQLSKLRGLRSVVSSIEYKINCHIRDIYQIHQLEQEGKRKATAEAFMQEVLPRFNAACGQFSEALEELKYVAAEHGIRVNAGDIKTPTSATFRQSRGLYDGTSAIYLSFTSN